MVQAGGEEPAEAAEGLPRWILDPAEVLALAALLARFPGGVFKSWLSAEIASWRADPQLNRLAAYRHSAPNPGDYAGRLLEFEGNEAAIDALAQAVARAPDPTALLDRLPARLRRLAQR